VVDLSGIELSSRIAERIADREQFSILNALRGAHYSDGFVHRQYCIDIRGIESFVHLFGNKNNDKNSSLFKAINLLNSNSHYFDRLKGEMTMFRNNSILKSILFDAFTNYLEYNSTLAHWRGLTNTKIRTSPIGYPNGHS
jgi:hypothetical protein